MSTREIFDGRIESAVLLLPTVLVSLVFLYYPAVRAFRTSLFDSSFGRQEVFVGVENYVTLLTDSGYHTNVLLSILFAVCVVVGVMVFSLYITFLIHEVDHGQTLYLISAIWPYALPPAVGALVFLFMVHPTLGSTDRTGRTARF